MLQEEFAEILPIISQKISEQAITEEDFSELCRECNLIDFDKYMRDTKVSSMYFELFSEIINNKKIKNIINRPVIEFIKYVICNCVSNIGYTCEVKKEFPEENIIKLYLLAESANIDIQDIEKCTKLGRELNIKEKKFIKSITLPDGGFNEVAYNNGKKIVSNKNKLKDAID